MIVTGTCVSPGCASGRGWVVDAETPLAEAAYLPATLPASGELERWRAAKARATTQLERVQRQLAARGNSQDAMIFAAHESMLTDATLAERIESEINDSGRSAESAVARISINVQQQFLASHVSMIRDKASDVLDIGQRLLKCLSGLAEAESASGAVVVARALTPSDLIRLVHQGVAAVITETCGLKSHTAILARGLGVPFVTGIASAVSVVPHGTDLLLDATSGVVIFDPTPCEQGRVDQICRQLAQPIEAVPTSRAEPITKDGVRITLLLNISDPVEVQAVHDLEVDGVGLYRTEFHYLARDTWPTEDESHETYRSVAAAMDGRELSIRLADFGAEKSPPYADIPVNRNPSLGIRGMRLLLGRDDILRPQVRALARVAQDHPITVLLPMIDTASTLAAATKKICDICHCRDRNALPFRLGMMVEVPSAAIVLDDLIEHVDSLSVGLNDLTQYLLAADRDDELVERYHDPLQPAVVRLLQQVLATADSAEKPVTMCGELAGNPELVRTLLSLGARRFSVSRLHFASTIELIRGESTTVELGV